MGIKLKELKKYIRNMQGMYDVVRLVEPDTCKILDVNKVGEEASSEKCYTIWGRSDRCENCSSFQACIRNRVQEKIEIRDGIECHVISIPAPLEMDGISAKDYVIELVSFGEKVLDAEQEMEYELQRMNEDALYVSMIGDKEASDEVISKAFLDSNS